MEAQTFAGDRTTFLTTTEAGQMLGLSPRTLEGLRVRGGGPPFRVHGARGGRVVYCLSDLLEWSEASRRVSTSDCKPTKRRGAADQGGAA